MRILLLILCVFFNRLINGQEFKYFNSQIKLFGKQITAPFSGGFQAPFIQTTDLNFDGKKDLVVFDRDGKKILTYIDTGLTEAHYAYAPQFEHHFSFITSWFLVRDYNRDGLDDFFCGAQGNVNVFKNTSTTGKLKFDTAYITLTDTEQIMPDLRANIYVDHNGIPSIEDIDGDGDMDLLTLSILSTYIELYQNMQVEANLPKDSMALYRVDPCWGSMGISFVNNNADLGISCQKNYRHSSAHFGSTFCVFDEDGDGDMDMLHGDVGYKNLCLFMNGKKQYNWKYDTIVSTDTLFPRYSNPVDLQNWPSAAYTDVNRDGIADLIVACNSPMLAQNKRPIHIYINKNKNKPQFVLQSTQFLSEYSMDMGRFSVPVLIDTDWDGDSDLVVATAGNGEFIGDTAYSLYLYENSGIPGKPNYILKDTNWLNLIQYKLSPALPAAGDINNDGKPDLLFGSMHGRLLLIENTGTSFEYKTDFFDSIDIGSFSYPAVGDLNKDGKNDLVIGNLYGNIYYFENNGKGSGKQFDLITDSLGKIYTNERWYDAINDEWYIMTEGNSAPHLSDINLDGELDLITGSLNGRVLIYKSIKNYINSTAPLYDSILYSYATDTFSTAFLGYRTAPITGFLDGDSIKDILIGNSRGGLHLLGSSRYIPRDTFNSIMPLPSYSPVLGIFPVPATEQLYIYHPEHLALNDLIILDLHGKAIQQKFTGNYITVSELSEGIYILKCTDVKGRIFTNKFMVQK